MVLLSTGIKNRYTPENPSFTIKSGVHGDILFMDMFSWSYMLILPYFLFADTYSMAFHICKQLFYYISFLQTRIQPYFLFAKHGLSHILFANLTSYLQTLILPCFIFDINFANSCSTAYFIFANTHSTNFLFAYTYSTTFPICKHLFYRILYFQRQAVQHL